MGCGGRSVHCRADQSRGLEEVLSEGDDVKVFKVGFDAKYFAYMVQSKREKDKLTLRELARLIGVSAPTLSRIESGNEPNIVTFGQICEWLRYDPAKFFYVDPERN